MLQRVLPRRRRRPPPTTTTPTPTKTDDSADDRSQSLTLGDCTSAMHSALSPTNYLTTSTTSMATPNRAALINRMLKVVRKHFKPVAAAEGSLAVRAPAVRLPAREFAARAAEQVFNTLKQDYFDWNEVRVSTIRELTEVLQAAGRPGRVGRPAQANAAQRVRIASTRSTSRR